MRTVNELQNEPNKTAKNAKKRKGKSTVTENDISAHIVDSATRVHTALGPGLLESAYEACMKHELTKRGLKTESQVLLPVIYDGLEIELGYRLDILVNNCVIIELKSVEDLTDIHRAQILSYLKLSRNKLGLLLNFNVYRMKDGIERFPNKL